MVLDQELVSLIRQGDDTAFEELFERYQGAIERHLARLTGSEAVAQDLLQEVFLRVWTRSEQWDGRGSFKGWLYKIATNLALNHLRTQRRRREQSLSESETAYQEEETWIPAWLVESTTLGPQAALEQAEEHELFQQILNRMPEEKQQAFRLVDSFELSIQDAAARLNVPEGTVKSRLHYARKTLAREWKGLLKDWE